MLLSGKHEQNELFRMYVARAHIQSGFTNLIILLFDCLHVIVGLGSS